MPVFFCYEVIDTIKEQTGITVMHYEDSPLQEGRVEDLPIKEGDVLLRMNYFGMRSHRSNQNVPCPVIEDHTHDLLGPWALNSNADWCIASIRKTLPLPEGGMMWSPKGHNLVIDIKSSEENEMVAAARWEGMEMKARYLNGEDISKDLFRKRFTETEEWFDHAAPVLLDVRSEFVVTKQLDINLWLGAKKKNWGLLQGLVSRTDCSVLKPENESCNMFSLILLFDTRERRDIVRMRLIEFGVFPAILWAVPKSASDNAQAFSERMLSVHCDGRYSEKDIRQLGGILNIAIAG